MTVIVKKLSIIQLHTLLKTHKFTVLYINYSFVQTVLLSNSVRKRINVKKNRVQQQVKDKKKRQKVLSSSFVTTFSSSREYR